LYKLKIAPIPKISPFGKKNCWIIIIPLKAWLQTAPGFQAVQHSQETTRNSPMEVSFPDHMVKPGQRVRFSYFHGLPGRAKSSGSSESD